MKIRLVRVFQDINDLGDLQEPPGDQPGGAPHKVVTHTVKWFGGVVSPHPGMVYRLGGAEYVVSMVCEALNEGAVPVDVWVAPFIPACAPRSYGHPHPQDTLAALRWRIQYIEQRYKSLDVLYQVLAEYVDCSKPLWETEGPKSDAYLSIVTKMQELREMGKFAKLELEAQGG